jgi:cobalt-precorrin 5A hydrolase
MKIAIIALTDGGKQLAEKISTFHADCFVDRRDLPVFEKLADLWSQKLDAIICIMATGIVVRGVSTLCSDKTLDPCVLVLDEKGQFVISLLSGHLGGGNQLARELALSLGGQAVITTASDVTDHTALDLWAHKNQLVVDDSQKLTEKSAKLVNNGVLTLFTDCELKSLPEDFKVVQNSESADIIISDALFPESQALILRPCALSVGLGCNRGTNQADFQGAVSELFADNSLNIRSIATFASIDLKNDEQGLLDFVSFEGVPIQFYTKEQLNSVDDVSSSAVVFEAIGAKGVAEPAAVLAAGTTFCSGKLIVRKRKWKDVTAAVAMKQIHLVA